jgi:hypothetical protein
MYRSVHHQPLVLVVTASEWMCIVSVDSALCSVPEVSDEWSVGK